MTTETREDTDIRNDGKRFTTTVDGVDGYIDYRREGATMVITHTIVPDEIGGRGIAGRLTRAAFEYARDQGWKVRPECSYAAAWAERNPGFASIVV